MIYTQARGFEHQFPPDPTKLVVTDGEQFEAMERCLLEAPVLLFDFETSGLAWWRHARPCGIALGRIEDNGRIASWYVPYRHQTPERQLDLERIAPALKGLLEQPDTLKVAHNIKFDQHMALREGWKVLGPRYCTLIAARIFDENTDARLKTRAEKDLGDKQSHVWEEHLSWHVKELAKLYHCTLTTYRDRFGYSQVPVQVCGRYACYDIEATGRLYCHYERKHHLWDTFSRVMANEMELTDVLCYVEESGLPIDVAYLEQLADNCHQQMADLETAIWRDLGAGARFDLGNDNQLRKFICSVPGIELERKGKSGLFKVDRDTLQLHAAVCPSLALIAQWRLFSKIATTYTTSIINQLDADGVLHGEFRQSGTETGRMSCTKPNLQNMPGDNNDRAIQATGKSLKQGGVDPFSVRRAFVNRGKGWVRLYFDYSQAELRVLTSYCRDPILLDSYAKGEDVHARTAMEIFGTADDSKRTVTKRINFGLVYGLSPAGLARQVKITVEEAQAYFSAYFQKYKGVPAYQQSFWSQTRQNGGTFFNMWGRRRQVPNLTSNDQYLRGSAERESFAALIQGTASELTKESMVRIARFFRERNLPALLVNSIHDEIQIDTPIECLTEIVGPVVQLMTNYPELAPVPVVVDGSYSTTHWAAKHGLPKEQKHVVAA